MVLPPLVSLPMFFFFWGGDGARSRARHCCMIQIRIACFQSDIVKSWGAISTRKCMSLTVMMPRVLKMKDVGYAAVVARGNVFFFIYFVYLFIFYFLLF